MPQKTGQVFPTHYFCIVFERLGTPWEFQKERGCHSHVHLAVLVACINRNLIQELYNQGYNMENTGKYPSEFVTAMCTTHFFLLCILMLICACFSIFKNCVWTDMYRDFSISKFLFLNIKIWVQVLTSTN